MNLFRKHLRTTDEYFNGIVLFKLHIKTENFTLTKLLEKIKWNIFLKYDGILLFKN